MNIKSLYLLGLAVASAVCPAYAQPAGEKTVRQNVALLEFGTTATCTVGTTNRKYPPQGLIDGNVSDEGAVRMTGVPAEIVLTFAEEREVDRVRLYPGLLEHRQNPSGACAPLDYELEGYVNNGWAPLAKQADLPPPSAAVKAEDYFIDHKFPAVALAKLRLRVTRSGDSGKRLGGKAGEIPSAARTTILREIQVFESTPGKPALKLTKKIAGYLSGDFRLPFYRHQGSARLDLLVEEGTPAPASILFRLKPVDGGEEVRQFTFPLKTGRNELVMDIVGLASGRYLATGTVQREGQEEEITRLLRIDRGSPAVHQPEGADLTGKIVYPIDDYHVESMNHLTVRVNPAEPHFVAWARLSPTESHWRNKIGPLSVTKDKQLVIPFQNAEGDLLVWQHAVCADPEGQPQRWEIRDGPAPKVTASAKVGSPSVKWEPKTPLDKAIFRFYDHARDGEVPLSEIHVFHTGTVRRDFGGLPITYRGTYPVWEKRAGEILFLSKEAMLEDVTLPGGETFEREKDTSDNFGGQFLSEDGQTLFYFAGSVVKRFPPYIVPYDNQRNSNRLFRVFYTRDGFRWEKQFILPQTEQDPWSLQQYGARIFKDPESDLYWGYLSSYHCERQQIYLDVMFSRDLLNWTRPGDQPFIASSAEPDTWRFGLTLPSLPSLSLGDRTYHLMGSTVAVAHFYHQENHTPEFLQQRFERRGLPQWPFFAAAGGYAGLSKSMDLAFNRRPVGMAVSRPNGLVALTAGEKEGTVVTRSLRASGALALNAATEPDGWVRVELLSPEGKPLPGFNQEFGGDDLRAPVFAKVPSGVFKIRLTAKKARVFAVRL